MSYSEHLLARRRGEVSLHLGYWPGEADRDLARAQAALDQRVLDEADLKDGQVVVDVGCGLGGTLLAASQRGRFTLHGVNLDERQLQVAREVVEATWHHGCATALPFADASVDALLCVEAAFHFPSREGFVAEARRVLRPGGRFVATDLVTVDAPPSEEPVIQAGIGPWPDFLEPTDWSTLWPGCSITDLSAQTLPSYRCFLGPTPGQDPMSRAVATLGRLHAAGQVRVLLISARR